MFILCKSCISIFNFTNFRYLLISLFIKIFFSSSTNSRFYLCHPTGTFNQIYIFHLAQSNDQFFDFSLPWSLHRVNNILECTSHEFLTTIPTCFHYVHFIGFLYFLFRYFHFLLISARIIQDQMDILFFNCHKPDCLLISNNLTMSHFYNFICLWYLT